MELERSLERGFVIYRVLLRPDPWLDPIRAGDGFAGLLDRARDAYRWCIQMYEGAGGVRLLGPAAGPEQLEAPGR